MSFANCVRRSRPICSTVCLLVIDSKWVPLGVFCPEPACVDAAGDAVVVAADVVAAAAALVAADVVLPMLPRRVTDSCGALMS